MLSEQALSRALERAGLHAPVRFDEVTGSTQATALRLAADGAPEWTLVAAGHQTEGRGRLGRRWTDEPGRALMFSFVLRPSLDPDAIGAISLLAGTAMTTACRDVAAPNATCKWPNDVLVNGRKAGGILAETRPAAAGVEFVVAGVGVNLGSPPSDVPNAAAVDADDEMLLTSFLRAFAGGYRPSNTSFGHDVVAAYRTVCSTLGSRVRARTTGGTVVEGDAVDVDETGALLVRVGDAVERVRFGEVEHLE
jgi:BirA family transcriptional regulator, biotin operon repressor / biotin---[acetyl-CoA-carboxylase] ligase